MFSFLIELIARRLRASSLPCELLREISMLEGFNKKSYGLRKCIQAVAPEEMEQRTGVQEFFGRSRDGFGKTLSQNAEFLQLHSCIPAF
jgi:hypothetical protein